MYTTSWCKSQSLLHCARATQLLPSCPTCTQSIFSSFPRLQSTAPRDRAWTCSKQQSYQQNTILLNEFRFLLLVCWCLNFQVILGSQFQASPSNEGSGKLTAGKKQCFSLIHRNIQKITNYPLSIKHESPQGVGCHWIAWSTLLDTLFNEHEFPRVSKASPSPKLYQIDARDTNVALIHC